MFRSSCPQCGAELEFKSAAAVMAVCPYCRSTLLKSGDALERIGAMTEALEDYSPIRLGVTGRHRGRTFTVVGRIQLRYPAGDWNEWYLSCDDGTDGWLSDASGQFVVTSRDDALSSHAALPRFESLQPGRWLAIGEPVYQVSDVRTAQCSGGEGELPFRIGNGWTARVADCRLDDAFVTLDYSDADAAGDSRPGAPPAVPVVYRGVSVEFGALALKGLRDEAEIREAAGRYRGDVVPFACPSCGASLSFVAGTADYVTCATCHAGVDCSGKEALVFEKQRDIDSVRTALSPGESGTFDGTRFTVLGVVRCRDAGHGWVWDEYLLHHPIQGLFWLVHGDEGWDRVKVLNRWPMQVDAQVVRFDGRSYRQGNPYQSEIVYAAGAFNWRAKVGDRVTVVDYSGTPDTRLTSELGTEELTWSHTTRVAASKIAESFGKPQLASFEALAGGADGESSSTSGKSAGGFGLLPWFFSAVLAVCNLDVLFDDNGGFILLLLPLIAIWLPPMIVSRFESSTGSGTTR